MRWNDDHLHSNGGSEQVNHLLVGECGHGNLAYLHQSAALPESSLPGITIGLHLCYNALKVDMKTQLSQGITTQGHLRSLTAFGQQLQKRRNEGVDYVNHKKTGGKANILDTQPQEHPVFMIITSVMTLKHIPHKLRNTFHI